MHITFQSGLIALCLALVNCTSAPLRAPDTAPSIIARYVDAYNARDVDGMAALMHPDIQWLSVEGDEMVVFADGKADLIDQMTAYVGSPQATTSTLHREIINGDYLAVKETASWPKQDGTTGVQSAIAVYELSDGLIRRVWYFPAQN